MSDRPYESWSRPEWTVVGTLAVVVAIYLAAYAGSFLGVSGMDRVADVASGFLWLTMSAWLLIVFTGLTPRWRAVGAAGFVVAGVTELALLFSTISALETLNLAGLLVALVVLVADLLGVV